VCGEVPAVLVVKAPSKVWYTIILVADRAAVTFLLLTHTIHLQLTRTLDVYCVTAGHLLSQCLDVGHGLTSGSCRSDIVFQSIVPSFTRRCPLQAMKLLIILSDANADA
jgi:hypothetical protein